MKVCIIHVDDEWEEPRQVCERIANDALPHFFRSPIEDAIYLAENGASGDVKISWTFSGKNYIIDYLKCENHERISEINIDDYQDFVFIFDVHRENAYGTGDLLIQSEESARKLASGKDFKAVIWTNFPNAEVVGKSKIDNVKLKRNVGDFAIELMELLGFSIHE